MEVAGGPVMGGERGWQASWLDGLSGPSSEYLSCAEVSNRVSSDQPHITTCFLSSPTPPHSLCSPVLSSATHTVPAASAFPGPSLSQFVPDFPV
jgi:hypothetical protein